MTTPRILSLLPSATEIIGSLGLGDCLVGVTHECDQCPDRAGMAAVIDRGIERVTVSDIDPHVLSQGDIDDAVKSSLHSGASLYTLREDAILRARPSVVLTQALCAVCAPSASEVEAVCTRLGAALADAEGREPVVINLEPGTLGEVADSFRTVADVCGVPERGRAVAEEFSTRLRALGEAVKGARPPKVLLLEWLNPPFDGGHWVPEQIEAAGCIAVTGRAGEKSRQVSWDVIEAADADVIVVACCGFDLRRNHADTEALLRNDDESGQRFRALRAVRSGRLFALDGNRYFARPAPSLAEGAAVIARVAHDADDRVVSRLQRLEFLPAEGEAWTGVHAGRTTSAAPTRPP